MKKILKQNEKKIYDLEKGIEQARHAFKQEEANFATFTTQVKKERKEVDKKNKKEFLDNLKGESKENQYFCDKCEEVLISEDKLNG